MIRSMHGLHHYHKRHGHKEDTPLKRVVDRVIYIVIGLALIMTLPQVKKVWIDRETSGVSAVSWGSYAVLNMFWLMYGVLHKEKPIIISSLAWIMLNGLVAIGALIY